MSFEPSVPDLARVGELLCPGPLNWLKLVSFVPGPLTWLELVSFVPGAPDLARVGELCARGSVID